MDNPVPDKFFRSHMSNKRCQAAMYLLTVASKALYYEASGINHELAIESMKEEASLNESMRNDEISRIFLLKISLGGGVKVRKKGRNGSFRNIHIQMVSNDSDVSYSSESKSYISDSCYLIWVSFWKFQKKFALNKLSVVVHLPNVNNDVDSKDSRKSIVEKEEVGKKEGKSCYTMIPIPFIRLANETRHIDLQFETFADYNGCLKSMSRFMDKTAV